MNDTALPDFAGALLATLGATALVAVIAWFVLAALRRAGVGSGGLRAAVGTRAAGKLRIVQTLPLGTRERAVLIADDEHEYLLGVAAGGVSLIVDRPRHAVKIPDEIAAEGADGAAKRGAAPFPASGHTDG